MAASSSRGAAMRSRRTWPAGLSAAGVIALGCAAPAHAASHLDVFVVPDARSVRPTQVLGFTIAVRNSHPARPQRVVLEDALPAGGDLSWAVDRESGIGGCAVSGPVGSQRLSCPPTTLAAGRSLSVHVFSHTWASTSPTVTDTVTVAGDRGRRASATASVTVGYPSCRGAQPDPSREEVFDDEFDGTGIDTSKWTVGSLPFAGLNGST